MPNTASPTTSEIPTDGSRELSVTGETVTGQPPGAKGALPVAAVRGDRIEDCPITDERTTPAAGESTGSARVGQPHPPPGTADPIPMSERIPVQVYTDESSGQKLSHWGPTVTSVASIVLTFFVWYNAQKLSEQQIELQRKQTQLQTEQVQAELADMRSKFFDDLTATDENKKTLAEIGLAGHGQKAMDVVHLALGVEQSEIRKSGANVVHRLFQAATNSKERRQLLDRLGVEFQSPNRTLRLGVVESLVKLGPLLDPDERRLVTEFLRINVAPQNTCSGKEGREMVLASASFANGKDPDHAQYLLDLARWPACGDGWRQAMINLQPAGEIPAPQRSALKNEVEKIKAEALAGLRGSVDDRTLAEGVGFTSFIKQGQVEKGVNFKDFARQVEAELDVVIKALSKP